MEIPLVEIPEQVLTRSCTDSVYLLRNTDSEFKREFKAFLDERKKYMDFDTVIKSQFNFHTEDKAALACYLFRDFIETFLAVRDTHDVPGFYKRNSKKTVSENLEDLTRNMYSLYCGAKETMAEMNHNGNGDPVDETEPTFSTEGYLSLDKQIRIILTSISSKNSSAIQKNTVVKSLISLYCDQIIHRSKDTTELLDHTKQFISAMPAAIESLIRKGMVEQEYLEQYSRTHFKKVKKSKATHAGFDFVLSEKGDSLNGNGVHFSDVIGDHALKDELMGSLKIISFYVPDLRENLFFSNDIYVRPINFLIEGIPGTGKSFLLEAAENELKEIAVRKGLQPNIIKVSNTLKTKYVGDAVNNLKKLISKVEDQSSIGMLILDDFDVLFGSSRESDGNASESQEDVVHFLLDWLYTPRYKGNYIVLMTTNFKEKIDRSFVSKSQERRMEGPKTAAELTTLLKKELGDLKKYVDMGADDYVYIGNLMTDYDFMIKELQQDRIRAATTGNGMAYQPPAWASALEKSGSPVSREQGVFRTLQFLLDIQYYSQKDFTYVGRDVNKLSNLIKTYIRNVQGQDAAILDKADVTKDQVLADIQKRYRSVSKEYIVDTLLKERFNHIQRHVEIVGEHVMQKYRPMVEHHMAAKLFEKNFSSSSS